MSRVFILLFCAALLCGCALSKDESTNSRTHDELAAKKKKAPAGSFTEDQVGVKFYPDADESLSHQYDEGGEHIVEVNLSTSDDPEKVKAFYEKEIGAKSMPMMPPFSSIQKDSGGKHYEVSYGRFDSDTNITIKVSTHTG